MARVDEDLLVVERHLDPRLAVPVIVVVTVVVVAFAGLVGNGAHKASGRPWGDGTLPFHWWGGFPGGSSASPLVTAAA